MLAPSLRVDADGWLPDVRMQPSENFDERPPGIGIELLVVHAISLPPGVFGSGDVERFFCNCLHARGHPFLELLSGLRASAHFLVERDGRLTQFVGLWDRAWHAGVSSFEGRDRCNDFSVGVELEGTDFTVFAEAQYVTLARLTQSLRRALPLRAVRGHCHIAPGRKTDPGPLFDWRHFAEAARLPPNWLP